MCVLLSSRHLFGSAWPPRFTPRSGRLFHCPSELAKNVPDDKKGTFGYGDVWTWTAIDADSKLIVSYLVGPRMPQMAFELMNDVAGRLAGRVQLTTDGLYWYPHAVENAFGIDVDYAVQTKRYGGEGQQGRYSPPKFVGSTQEVIRGNPDAKHISTSYRRLRPVLGQGGRSASYRSGCSFDPI